MATILKNNKQEKLTENTKSGARFVLRSIISQELLAINSNVIDVIYLEKFVTLIK